METIYDYLKEYGKYSFLEEKFNEVDNVILSLISYIDLYGIVPSYKRGKITIKDASELFYKKYTKKEVDDNILAVRSASHMLGELAKTKRYQDLLLYNYEYKVTFDMQFGALCVLLPDKSVYVSYEGTDGYISGWKEDCMFSYKFPTDAQKEAVYYLDSVIGLFTHKVYVGGHSKGGNLAIIASMYCNPIIRHKIKAIYNNDGPGLRNKEFNSNYYKKISSKVYTYVPKESFIGMILNHQDTYIVVDSKNKKFFQHDAFSWLIQKNQFKRVELSDFSKKVEKGLNSWLDKLDDASREKFFNALFSILKKAEINELSEFKKAKFISIVKLITQTKNLDKETKNMIIMCFKNLLSEIRK